MSRPLRARFQNLFSEHGFRGPVLTLLSGSTVTLGVSYLAQPILRRLYTPAEFGLLELFVAIVTVLMQGASLRYEDAIMQPDDERDTAQLWWLAVLLSVGSAAALVLLLPWRYELARLMGDVALAPWLLAVPPALLAMRLFHLSGAWLIRHSAFRALTKGNVLQTLTLITARIVAAVPPIAAGTGGLIGSYVLAGFVGGGVQLRRVFRGHGRLLRRMFSWAGMARQARRYWHFALYSMPSSMLGTLVMRLPVLLLAPFFGNEVVGLFGLAFSALAIPLGAFGSAIARVFFPRAADALRTDTLAPMVQTVYARLVAIGLFPTLVVMVAGPDLFAFVFGEAWREAGVYIRYVGPWLYLASVASPLTALFDILERQRTDLLLSVLFFLTHGAALVAGGLTGDVLTTLLYVGIAGACMRLLQIDVLLKLAGAPMGRTYRPFGRYLLFAAPCLLPLALVLRLQSPLLTTGVAALCGSAYYALVAWRDGLLQRT